MGIGGRSARLVVATVATVVLAAACGARVSGDVHAAQADAATGRAATVAGDAPDTAAAAGDAAGPARGAAPSAAGSSGAAATGAAATGAPTGNGGATDVGVTATQVLLGNVATLSGPVPGLFQGAVIGTQAVVAYENAKGGLFGRTFKLDVRDDQFDTGQNRAQTEDQLGKVFAIVGSFSLYDDAAVDAIGRSGIPDLSVPINQSRQRLPNNLSVAPIDMSGGPTGGFEWFQQQYPDAVKAVGTLYGDVPAGKAQLQRMQKVAEALGWKFVYSRGYQPTETDFTADVLRMRQAGVKGIYLFGADDKTSARLATAMKQQSFKPSFVILNYAPSITDLAGDAVDGWYGIATQSLFADPQEAALNPEVKLFQEWIQKVKPGFKPDLYAAYGWALGRLLFQAMETVGPKPTRAAVIDAIRRIGAFSANDVVAPANPGAKVPAICFIVARIQAGTWRRVDPARGFDCRGRYLHT